MTYSVYQHWDPLKVCVVGRTYPPEFYHWITNADTRKKFEQLAEETEQDFQQLIALLCRFGVEVIRPALPCDLHDMKIGDRWAPPPVTPRDYFVMIHDQLWIPQQPNQVHAQRAFQRQSLDWPTWHGLDLAQHQAKLSCYRNIFDHVEQQGNAVCFTDLDVVSGCFVSRLGHDLYFATQTPDQDQTELLHSVNQLFPNTNNRIVDAQGHGDATYCAVTPGLIVSLRDVPTYADTFPDWEVVYLEPSDFANTRQFRDCMKLNRGRWYVPGFEQDTTLRYTVEHYFDSWVGHAAETVFDVNILVVDQHNIVVSSHSDAVEQACARHGVEVHVSPFRHRYFWDAGIHCVTNDLDRDGTIQKYFD